MNIINHEMDLCDEVEYINNLFCVQFSSMTMQSCSFYFETVVKVSQLQQHLHHNVAISWSRKIITNSTRM